MDLSVQLLRNWSVTSGGRKTLRYLVVSVLNIVLGEAVLGVSYLFFHWSAQRAAIVAVILTTIPAYFLNRMWVWGTTGRSHLLKEVVPFWILAFLSLGLSVWAAQAAETMARNVTGSRLVQTVILMGAILVASGVLWTVRFIVLDTVVFSRPHPSTCTPQRGADARG